MFTTTTTQNGMNGYRHATRRTGAEGYVLAAMLLCTSTLPATALADKGGPCVSQGGMSVMFEPGTSEADAYDIAAGHINPIAFIPEGGTWTFTATDGAVEQGQAITLSYSFVPDGTPIFSTYADQDTVSNLFATMDAEFPGGRAAWKQKFAEAFAEWGSHTNITYVEVADDGAPISSTAFGVLGIRGDIRIGMHDVGDGPLAYNFHPIFGGDMVLDSLDMATFTNPASNFRSLRNVIMHEHGHGLGMAHVIPGNGTKLMEPNLSTAFDGPQEDDIRAAQSLYGDRDEPNEFAEDARFIGGPLQDPAVAGTQTLTVEGVALERTDSTDWYAFTAFAGAPIAVRVEPMGTTYQYGPQDGTAAFVNAKAARDLKFRLWRRVSSQTGELAFVAQIGFNDAGEAEYHPPVPYTPAGYMLVEIYSEDGVDDVQTYTLTVSNSAIAGPVEPPLMSVADGVTPIVDGDLLLFPATEIAQTSGKALTIRNLGNGPLVFDNVPAATVAGPGAGDFEVQFAASDVEPDGFAVLGINFTPTATGQRVAVLSIPNNDPDNGDFSIIIRGEGLQAPEAVLQVEWENQILDNGDQLDFGELTVGQTLTTNLTLRNTGEAALDIDAIRLTGDQPGDYALDLEFSTLAPGGELTGTLSATPSSDGVRNATLSITSNAAEPTFEVPLSTLVVNPIVDCNGNGVDDSVDVQSGEDCNANGTPDECEPDSDGDGIIDSCDNCPNTPNADQLDTDANGVGDECDGIDDEPVVDDGTDDGPNENDQVEDDGEVEDDQAIDPNEGNTDDVDNGDLTEDDSDALVDNDDVVEDDNQSPDLDGRDQKDSPDDFESDDGDSTRSAGFCGAGALGMIPLMMSGLCGMRTRRRR